MKKIERKHNKLSGKHYSVWVGGSEVNDYYLSREDAISLANEYRDNGYDDVVIEKVEKC